MKTTENITEKWRCSENTGGLTFHEAAAQYIALRQNILSPSTVREYKRTLARDYEPLRGMSIYDITVNDVQALVNLWATHLSAKSVANLHGFLSHVLRIYRPEFHLSTSLPQKTRPSLYMPTDEEVRAVLRSVSGTSMEVPVILAACSGMRRSEVCALAPSDVKKGVIRGSKALVQDHTGNYVIKTTKSTAGTRLVYLPVEATDRIHDLAHSSKRVVSLNPTQVTLRFAKILDDLGIPHFRYHDLRAYWATVQHTLGVPDIYIMKLGGWKDRGTLQSVYERPQMDKIPEMANPGIEFFSKMIP